MYPAGKDFKATLMENSFGNVAHLPKSCPFPSLPSGTSFHAPSILMVALCICTSILKWNNLLFMTLIVVQSQDWMIALSISRWFRCLPDNRGKSPCSILGSLMQHVGLFQDYHMHMARLDVFSCLWTIYSTHCATASVNSSLWLSDCPTDMNFSNQKI